MCHIFLGHQGHDCITVSLYSMLHCLQVQGATPLRALTEAYAKRRRVAAAQSTVAADPGTSAEHPASQSSAKAEPENVMVRPLHSHEQLVFFGSSWIRLPQELCSHRALLVKESQACSCLERSNSQPCGFWGPSSIHSCAADTVGPKRIGKLP